jgi:tetratricopeptide (TPR) repeat protein
MEILHSRNWFSIFAKSLCVAMLVASSLGGAMSSVAWAGDDEAEADEEAGQRYYNRAIYYTKTGKNKKAIEFFEKALPFMNDSSDIFYNLVHVAYVAMQWDKVYLYGLGFLYHEPDTDDAKDIDVKARRAAKYLIKWERGPVPVTFKVKPRGVLMKLNHVFIANTGDTIELPPGDYEVFAEKEDYIDYEDSFKVKVGEPKTVRGRLVKRTYYGKLSIATDPSDDVEVYIDDKLVGKSPVTEPLRLQTGRYLVRFEKEDFDRWHRYVDIRRDQTYELAPVMELTPLPPDPKATDQRKKKKKRYYR